MGNVLINFSHEKACVQLARTAGVTPQQIREALFDSGLETDYEAGKHTTDEVHARLERDLRVRLSLDAMLEAACDIFTRNESMESLVGEIRSRGHRLVMLSNVNEAHFDWIAARYPFPKLFDALVLSYKVGAVKPDAAIYHAALKAAQHSAGECLFIDDMPENVTAARHLGIHAHHFQGEQRLRSALRELRIL